jgi:hypothetical protein
MAAAGAVLALCCQPVLRPEAACVLAVSQESLVVQLQAAQGLTLLLRLQRAKLGGSTWSLMWGQASWRARTSPPLLPSARGQCAVLP